LDFAAGMKADDIGLRGQKTAARKGPDRRAKSRI
jgi:hypothetical protein